MAKKTVAEMLAAAIAAQADQRSQLDSMAKPYTLGGGAGEPRLSAPSSKDIALATMSHTIDTGRGVLGNGKPMSETDMPHGGSGKSFFSKVNDASQSFNEHVFSGGQRILDILSRPNMASANVTEALYNGQNPIEGAWEGLSGKDKKYYADVIKEQDVKSGDYKPGSDAQYGVAGFIADVVLDPTTYIGAGLVGKVGKAIGKGLEAIPGAEKLMQPAVKNTAKLEQRVVPEAVRADAEVKTTGTTTVGGPNAAKDLANRLARESKSAEVVPSDIPVGAPAAAASEVTQPTADALLATSKGQEVAAALAQMKMLKHGEGSFVRRIAQGDETLPLPLTETTDPVAQALYKRQMSAYRMNSGKRAKAMSAYEEAAKASKSKTLPAMPREDAASLARRAAVMGRSEVNAKPIISKLYREGKTPDEIGHLLDSQAQQEGRRLSIPLFVKNRSGKYSVGMEVNIDAFENLLHTGKVAKPIPLSAKGDIRQATRTVKEVDANGVPTGRFKEVPVEGRTTGSLYYTAGTGKKRAAFKATEQHSAFLSDAESVAEDLQRLHIIDPDNGKVVPLGQFLKSRNIDVSTLQAGDAGTIAEKLTGLSKARRTNPNYGQPIPDKPVFKSDLVEPTAPTRTFAPFDKETLAKWRAEHAPNVDTPTLYKVLNGKAGDPKTPEAIRARAEALGNETVAANFKDLPEAIAAFERGDVAESEFKGLLDIMRAKSVKELPAAVDKLFARMKNTEKVAIDAALKVDPALDAKVAEVKPAEEILNEIGHSSVLDNATTQELNGFQKASVDAAVQKIVDEQFIKPRSKAEYPHKTSKGVPRTHKTPGEGRGTHKSTANEWAQTTGFKQVMADSSRLYPKYLEAAKAKGEPVTSRAQWIMDRTMPMVREVERTLRANNIPVVLSEKASGIPLGLSDIIDALPEELVMKYFFTPQKSLDPSQVMRIGEHLVNYGLGKVDADLTVKAVLETLAGPRTAGRKVLTDPKGNIQFSAFSRYIANKEGRDAVANDVAKGFLEATPRIMEAANHRAAELGLKVGEFAKPAAESTIQSVIEKLADPFASNGAKIQAIAESEKLTAKASDAAVKAQGIAQAPVGSVEVAQQIVKQKISTLDGADDARFVADTAETIARAMKSGDLKVKQNAEVKAMKESAQYADNLLRQEVGDHMVYDLGAQVEVTFAARLARYMFGHIGNSELRPLLINRQNVASTNAKHVAKQLGLISQRHTPANINAAFTELQLGRTPTDEYVKAAYNDVRKVFGDIYGFDAPDYSVFTRLGVTGRDVDYYADKFGIPESARFGAAKTPEEMAATIANWEVDDVLETLNRVHAATQTAGIMRIIGSDVSARWGYKTADAVDGEKMVHLKDVAGKSIIGRIVDRNLYYPEHIAQQLHVFESSLRTLHDPLTRSKVLRWYDGVLHSFKAGWTIYRPGHHIRNMNGDLFFNYMDGVTHPKYYNNALSVLHVGRSQYKDWDSLQALTAAGLKPDDSRIVLRSHGYTLTAKQAHKLMYGSGALPDYRVIEDVAFGKPSEDISGILRRNSPFKGRVHDAAATVSEVRDHYVRASHWLKAFEDVKIPPNIHRLPSEEQLRWIADEATHRVRKWHPDGSDLTNAEKKVARRIIPFYSWMRKAIPLVLESIAMRPGRTLVYPKAMYNAAASMGIDLQSLGNPFPEDQLFPSWLQDSTQGPTFEINGRYYGIRPGIPTADVMDDYMSSPVGALQTILGSLTPALKIPPEIATQTDIRTGVPIKDTTDYIDRQIPGVSNIASLTGRSPSSGFTQPTSQAATAEKYGSDPSLLNPVYALNLLLGAGVTDMSKPNYIKQAQLEERTRARDAYRQSLGG